MITILMRAIDLNRLDGERFMFLAQRTDRATVYNRQPVDSSGAKDRTKNPGGVRWRRESVPVCPRFTDGRRDSFSPRGSIVDERNGLGIHPSGVVGKVWRPLRMKVLCGPSASAAQRF